MALRAGYHGIKNIKGYQIMTRSEQAILGAKNFAKNYNTAQTVTDVTFTPDANDSNIIVINTTAQTAAQREYVLNSNNQLKVNELPDKLIISGTGSDDYGIEVNYRDNNNTYISNQKVYANDVKLNIPSNAYYIRLVLFVKSGVTVSNKTVKIMLRLASDPDNTYAPYANTNRELTVNRFEKGVITNTSDLNDVTETGIYKVRTAPAHSPENTGFCSLIVNTIDTNQCIQIINKHNVMYQRRKYSPSTGTFEWSNWYKFTGTEVTPASLTSASPETRSEEPELTEDEPIVKKTTTRKATKKTEEV